MKLWEVDKISRLIVMTFLFSWSINNATKMNLANTTPPRFMRPGIETRKDAKNRSYMAQLVFLSMLHPYKLSAKQLLK